MQSCAVGCVSTYLNTLKLHSAELSPCPIRHTFECTRFRITSACVLLNVVM
jgi:hypothetical protein